MARHGKLFWIGMTAFACVLAAACENTDDHAHAAGIAEVDEIRPVSIPVAGADYDSVDAYYRASDGDADNAPDWRIIVVPGTPSQIDFWGGAVAKLDSRAEVYAIERPGYRGSGPARAVTSLKEQASVLGALVYGFEGGVILIGHSYGASVALAALDMYGQDVDGVVLVSPYVLPARGQKSFLLRIAQFTPLRFVGGASTNRSIQEIVAQRRQSEAMLEIASRSCTPVQIIHGDRDDTVPLEDAIALLAYFPECADAKLEMVEGGDHFLSVHSADALASTINVFLGRVALLIADRPK